MFNLPKEHATCPYVVTGAGTLTRTLLARLLARLKDARFLWFDDTKSSTTREINNLRFVYPWSLWATSVQRSSAR